MKTNPIHFKNLHDFIKCYNPTDINKRKESWSQENPNGRWRKFSYHEIMLRDRINLDISWVKDENLTDYSNLKSSKVLAEEIMISLQQALDGFKRISLELNQY